MSLTTVFADITTLDNRSHEINELKKENTKLRIEFELQITTLYNLSHDSIDEINELKKENTKLLIKFELQEEEITAQNKQFAKAIAYNFSKNININNDIKTIKETENKQENKISYIINLIEEITIWKNEWIDWFGEA